MIFEKFCLGTWSMGGGDSWGSVDAKESARCIDTAIDLGVKWIDTAPAYGNGKVESFLGEVLSGKRDKVKLTTKCGLVWNEEGSYIHMQRDGVTIYRNLRKESLKRQVEDSLKRLKTDYVDVLLTHHQNPNDPLEETIEALEQLKKEGKILSYGASNVNVDQLNAYLSCGKPEMIQNQMNVLDNKDFNTFSLAESKGVFYQAYSPLKRGLLAGTVKSDAAVVGTAKTRDPWYNKEGIDRINNALLPIKEIAASYSVPLSAVILSYHMSLSSSIGVCVGARKSEQIIDSFKANAILLKADEKDLIASVMNSLRA